MVDASNKLKREQLDLSVLKLLEKFPVIPSVLILNKVKCLVNVLVKFISPSSSLHSCM